MANKRDYYEVLGVSKTATEKEIKSAYRKMAMKYHPDRYKEKDAEAKMQEINEAYEVLSDSQKRQMYDQYGHEGANAQNQGFSGFSGFGGFEDIFGDIFGGFTGRRNNSDRTTKGEDKQVYLDISFIESYNGLVLHKKFPKYENCLFCNGTGADSNGGTETCSTCHGSGHISRTINTIFGQQISNTICSTCHGSGKVIIKKCSNCKGDGHNKVEKEIKINVPAGIQDGAMLRTVGYGYPGTNGGPAGDLYFVIRIKPHRFFRRIGNDLFLDLPISFIDIMLEKVIEVPTPNSNQKIKLKKSYQNGQIIKISGLGFPYGKGTHRGDLKINLQIIIPDLSNKDKKELLNLLTTLEDKTNKDFVNLVNKTK
ncbi:molecular chaperone DnaJ [Mycoplasmopsis sturni]|uniref:molecular chaperone DnaJ n=1 Tax=Mycoplasmopsis sturni TaxID=39047 RepID=UPI00055BA450|nr:molecular chaperone DnaJ [Mycoplasmopsis sturni]